MNEIIEKLLNSDEPSIRYRIARDVLDKDPGSPEMLALQEEIRSSDRVRQLLSERQPDGTLPHGAYFKWAGPHWTLAMLAEMGYPPGDGLLIPLREQEYGWLLGVHHIRAFEEKRRKYGPERIRRCGSQEGYAIFALHTLGLADERVNLLVDRLLECQWPDGGWNCDWHPKADTSSFHETWLPMRAIWLVAQKTGDEKLKKVAERAAEIFLQRKMFRRLHGGEVINPNFLELHYPFYWHYTVLTGLKVITEMGLIHDPRCEEALNWLETRELPEGGYAADTKIYRVTTNTTSSGCSLAGWGKANGKAINEFVTVEALTVLHAAGRVQEEGKWIAKPLTR